MWKMNKICCRVVRARSNPTSLSRLELTPWDLRLIQLVPIQRGLIFHKPKIDQNFIHYLINSLSRTLDFFPPLAGRLVATRKHDGTTDFFVDCNNHGAEFIHATAADVSVSDIMGPTYIPESVNSFFPLNDSSNLDGVSKPLLAVQLTELADGLFMTCAANHAVVDGTSFWHFFNSYSEICRGFETISKLPVFSRLTSCPSTGLSLTEQTPSQIYVPPPLLRRVFHFSRESLVKLKSKANSEAGTDKISCFQALSGLLWRTMTRIQENPRSGEVDFVLIVGARSRIGLEEGYFGNVIYTCATSASEREVLQNGIGYASLKINVLVSQQTGEAAMADFGNSENGSFVRKMGSFLIIGSTRHNVYDFGWGKPIAARSGKGRHVDGKMTVFPAAECGGVDLEVCLATEKLLAMEDDPEFVAALTGHPL